MSNTVQAKSPNGWVLWLLLLAAVQLLILWIAGYSKGNLDDKAVHYYSAARLFAGPVRVEQLAAAEPGWMKKLPNNRQFRTLNRLHSFGVYPVYGAILRSVCSAWPGASPPYSYSIPVKISFLLLFLFALGWLFAVTLPNPVDGALTAVCLLIGGLGLAVPLIAPAADKGMDFLAYAPRGSAALMILAAFACFARGRGLLAAVSLLLAFGWHAGFAAVAVPCAAGAIAITLCDRAGSHYIRIMTAILTFILALFFVHGLPGPFLQFPVWIPTGFVMAFLLAGPVLTVDPIWRATASLAAFLFLSLGVIVALQYPPVRDWLVHMTGNPLVAEIPNRLSGVRHLAALALALTALTGVLNGLLPARLTVRTRHILLLSSATLVLAACAALGLAQWPTAGHKAAVFLHAEEGLRARPVPTGASLDALDPRREDSFFAALGDYLLSPLQADSHLP